MNKSSNSTESYFRKHKKIITMIIAVGVIGFILSPLPGIEAAVISLAGISGKIVDTTASIAFFDVTVRDNVNDDCGGGNCAGTGTTFAETIPENSEIVITIDGNTASEQECVFFMDGDDSDLTNCTGITGLAISEIHQTGNPAYEYFGYGYAYLYGIYYTLGSYYNYLFSVPSGDSYVYGLTAGLKNDGATPFTNDVTATYAVTFNNQGFIDGPHSMHVEIFPPGSGVGLINSAEVFFTVDAPTVTPGTPFALTPDTPLLVTTVPGLRSIAVDTPGVFFDSVLSFPGAGAITVAQGGGTFTPLVLFETFGTTPYTMTVTLVGVPATATFASFDPLIGWIPQVQPVPPVTNADGSVTFTVRVTHNSPKAAGTAGAAAAGPGGGGGAGGGGGGGAGFAGVPGQPTIYEISYDVCEANMVTVTAGPSSGTLGVKIRTSSAGVTTATAADEQPYTNKIVFEAPINPSETFFMVQVDNLSGRDVVSAKKSVNISGCTGTIVVTTDEGEPVTRPPVSEPAPSETETFTVEYNGIEVDVDYQMDGTITDVTVDEDANSVTFSLANVKGGEAIIKLPHELVYAENDSLIVLVDGEAVDYEVVETGADYVTISLMLPAGASELMILGTSVIPEFGVIAMVILAVAIVGIVVATRYQRFPLVK